MNTRKLFTLPTEIAERLGRERNQSATVAEALDVYFNHKDLMRKLANNTERIIDHLEKKDKPTASVCCGGPRPDPETEAVPCRHWLRRDEGFVNTQTGEVFEF